LLNIKTDNYKIIKYLEVQINKNEITKIIKKINVLSNKILRENEKIYKLLSLDNVFLSTDQVVDIIIANPILLQRPIIAKYQNNELIKAVIGRSSEEVLSILV
jgi:arsenate reductase (glutaredoxin)